MRLSHQLRLQLLMLWSAAAAIRAHAALRAAQPPLRRPALAPSQAVLLSATYGVSPPSSSSSSGSGVGGRRSAGGRTTNQLRVSSKKGGLRPAKNWRVLGLYRKAQGCISVGDFEEARSLLEACLELDSRDAYCWLSLARLEARTGDAAQARLRFDEARATCPNNVRLVHAHAVFEQRSGRAAEARALFAEAARMEPGNAYVSHAWGLLEESMGNVSAAQTIYADLMHSAPPRPQAQVRGGGGGGGGGAASARHAPAARGPRLFPPRSPHLCSRGRARAMLLLPLTPSDPLSLRMTGHPVLPLPPSPSL